MRPKNPQKKKGTLTRYHIVFVVVLCITVWSLVFPRLLDGNNGNASLISFFGASSPEICFQNPYHGAIRDKLEDVASRADSWLSNIDSHIARATSGGLMETHTHFRFFPFQEMAECSSKRCIGGECGADDSKIACGVEELKDGCIIYSIGGDNQWDFERDLLQKTPCEIHTFDCTGDISRFQVPAHPRLFFHHVCLSATSIKADPPMDDQGKCTGKGMCGDAWTLLEMQQKLNHTRIDLLKIDVEGWEWPLLESWPQLKDPQSNLVTLPMQILVEVSITTTMERLPKYSVLLTI
jgi:hypothetical protein